MGASQGAGLLDPRFDRAPCLATRIGWDSNKTTLPIGIDPADGRRFQPPDFLRSYTTFPMPGMNAAKWESG